MARAGKRRTRRRRLRPRRHRALGGRGKPRQARNPRPSAFGCRPPRPAAALSARFAGPGLGPAEKKGRGAATSPVLRSPFTEPSGAPRSQGKARHHGPPTYGSSRQKEDEAPPPTPAPSSGSRGPGKAAAGSKPPAVCVRLPATATGRRSLRPLRGPRLRAGVKGRGAASLAHAAPLGPPEPGQAAAGSKPPVVCLRHMPAVSSHHHRAPCGTGEEKPPQRLHPLFPGLARSSAGDHRRPPVFALDPRGGVRRSLSCRSANGRSLALLRRRVTARSYSTDRYVAAPRKSQDGRLRPRGRRASDADFYDDVTGGSEEQRPLRQLRGSGGDNRSTAQPRKCD